MDALRLAFDTIIVGIFAVPWMFLLLDLCVPNLWSLKSWGDLLSSPLKEFMPAIVGVFALSMTYFLGSAVARLATNLLDDDDVRIWTTEHAIRQAVYCGAELHPVASKSAEKLKAFVEAPGSTGNGCSAAEAGQVQSIFALEEGRLLLEGQDKTDRLKQLHQQIVVLSGVAFNAFVLAALCSFGFCAQKRKNLLSGNKFRWLVVLTFLPCALLLAGAGDAFVDHYSGTAGLNDPPLIEIVLLALGLFGVVVLFKNVKQRPYGVLALSALLVALLAYGGWWATELSYSTQIIYSFATLGGK